MTSPLLVVWLLKLNPEEKRQLEVICARHSLSKSEMIRHLIRIESMRSAGEIFDKEDVEDLQADLCKTVFPKCDNC